MTTLGQAILSVVNFLTVPAWHLVVVFAILLIIIAYSMIKEWGFTNPP